MATDRRRIPGPESSAPPLASIQDEEIQQKTSLFNSDGTRNDGRRRDQHRPICTAFHSTLLPFLP